jgi:hypothetical protein
MILAQLRANNKKQNGRRTVTEAGGIKQMSAEGCKPTSTRDV